LYCGRPCEPYADDLIEKTYLIEPDNDGNWKTMQLIELLDHEDPTLARFKAVSTDKTIEYNTILDRVEKVDGKDSM